MSHTGEVSIKRRSYNVYTKTVKQRLRSLKMREINRTKG